MKKRPDKENLREDWFGGRIVNGISKGGKGFLKNPLKSVTDTLRGGLRLGFDQAFGILGDLLKSMGVNPSVLKYIIYAVIIISIIIFIVYVKKNIFGGGQQQPYVIMQTPPSYGPPQG
jgi:hypothetical protein